MTKVYYDVTDGYFRSREAFVPILRDGTVVLLSETASGFKTLPTTLLKKRNKIPLYVNERFRRGAGETTMAGLLPITKKMVDDFWAWHDDIVESAVARGIV